MYINTISRKVCVCVCVTDMTPLPRMPFSKILEARALRVRATCVTHKRPITLLDFLLTLLDFLLTQRCSTIYRTRCAS